MNKNNKSVIQQWSMPAKELPIEYPKLMAKINGWKADDGRLFIYTKKLQVALSNAIISGKLIVRDNFTWLYLEPGLDAYKYGIIDFQDFCDWANKAGLFGVPDNALKLAHAFEMPTETYLSESQQAFSLTLEATTSPAPEPQATSVGAVIASGGMATDKAGPVTMAIRKNRQGWRDVTWPYLLEVLQSGNYSTAKDFYKALERKAGADSPFELGTGLNRGSLFIRQINQKISLKTVQNYAWKELRESR